MKHIKHLAVTAAMLLCYITASAYNFEVDGIYYNITSTSSLIVEVTHKTSDYNSYSGQVVIPATVTYNNEVYTVTSIGNYAFKGCINLTNIMLSESVTNIGSYAFSGCSSLTSITIPKGVTIVSFYAFDGCIGLKELTIVDSASSLSLGGLGAFLGTPAPLFHDCPLEKIYLGRNVDYNANWGSPFSKKQLVSVTIGDEVTGIGDDAFSGCSSLTSITIPENVTSIGSSAFLACSNLTSIVISENSKLASIGSFAFSGCSSLKSVIIPEGVTSIGRHTFSNCNNLTSIAIPKSVTLIGQSAFAGCSSLASVTIPEDSKLTSIETYAFESCSTLASLRIPGSVTLIANYVFRGCLSLKHLTFEDGDEILSIGCDIARGKGLFCDCPLETLYLGRNLSYNTDFLPYLPFYENTTLTSVVIGDKVTSIDYGAFYNCSNLTSITIPENSQLASIGERAFFNCSDLTSINIPESVRSIGDDTFYGCNSLTSITISENSQLTSIGNSAFYNCSNLTSITIPEGVTSIGNSAFKGLKEVVMKSTTPPVLTSSYLISDYAVITVPVAVFNDYCEATYWTDLTANITIDDADARVKNLTLEADEGKSALQIALGDESVKFVTDLTISGTINSYDFMIMRNKMPVLRHLNLRDANIVHNAYEHYTGYHTDDNKFPGYGLYNCNLFTLVLPETITNVGYNAIASNNYLSEVTLFEGVTSIGNSAFNGCSSLTSITLPKGVTGIGNSAFNGCSSLTSITLPKGVTSIGGSAFESCSSLNSIVLPPTVKTIGGYAFYCCSRLKEIRIPSSARTVGDNAFLSCNNLNDVYVYTVEPINIGQNTFMKDGNNFVGTLHAPKISYWDYYYDTQWSQFVGFVEFDEPYENFYVEGDKVLDSETGDIRGDEEGNDPDAEMGENSGIIVEDDIEQDLGDVDIEHDGEHGGSIIVGGEGHVHADKLHFRINVKGGRWYFFCFPFDIKVGGIKMEGGADWVFRYYDGAERAKNGKGGWKNVTSDGEDYYLKAGTGYIFQCSKDDVLVISVRNKKLMKENKYNELVAHVTENAHDASWNFVGNPYLSYYEVTSDDYSAPITVWDGNKYIAIRPGDDDYQLAPFEAFFVQKPEGKDKVNYDPERQMTYHQSQAAAAQARARRRSQAIDPDRLLVNLTLTDGTATDQTRVVFNNSVSMGYEMACDAAKFSTAGVPQLYTIDSRAVKYAINERPVAEGIVTVGFTAPAEGVYTLSAPRMDTPMLLRDNATGAIHDFAEGSYEFASGAGTFDDRFTVMMKAGETAIDEQRTVGNESPVYNIKGQRVDEATEQGVYIKGDRKVVKM